MSSVRVLAVAVLAAGAALLAAASGAAARTAVPQPQQVTITIGGGDRVVEPNFALVPGVPVRIAVVNRTAEFHTFTIPALGLSALIKPSRTTTVAFTPHAVGPLAWHCVICPSGQHGAKHSMSGVLYLIVDPSARG